MDLVDKVRCAVFAVLRRFGKDNAGLELVQTDTNSFIFSGAARGTVLVSESHAHIHFSALDGVSIRTIENETYEVELPDAIVSPAFLTMSRCLN